ncbi:hypothetical protein, partial [uncultured Microbacterium sp.]|uniref:hypothetical protein n=1 Tax=uncultured Microbacterium sp. TaxID=191216 RepID=UPI0028D144C2
MTTTTRRARTHASSLPRRASWEAPPENLPTRRSQNPRRRTSPSVNVFERPTAPRLRRFAGAERHAETSVFAATPTRESPAEVSVFAAPATRERHTGMSVFAASPSGTPLPIDAEAPAAAT